MSACSSNIWEEGSESLQVRDTEMSRDSVGRTIRTWRKSASMLLFMWKKPKKALFRLITIGKISGTGTPDVLQRRARMSVFSREN